MNMSQSAINQIIDREASYLLNSATLLSAKDDSRDIRNMLEIILDEALKKLYQPKPTYN